MSERMNKVLLFNFCRCCCYYYQDYIFTERVGCCSIFPWIPLVAFFSIPMISEETEETWDQTVKVIAAGHFAVPSVSS